MAISRRDVLLGSAGLAAGAGLAGQLGIQPALAQAAPVKFTPEKGAQLRVLRWAPFVKGEEDAFLANTKKFSDATGVQVRVDKEGWEDIRPKAAVAANVGAGPDIVLVWFDDAFQYPDKLVDVTDLADDLGSRYGGWYAGIEGYAKKDGKFIGLPLGAISNAILYRESWVKEAGFSTFPDKTDAFLEMCKALKAKNHPAGFAFGKAVGVSAGLAVDRPAEPGEAAFGEIIHRLAAIALVDQHAETVPALLCDLRGRLHREAFEGADMGRMGAGLPGRVFELRAMIAGERHQ